MPTLNFKGKSVIETYHHTVPHHRLEFVPKLSLLGKGEKPSLDGNLIIEGDNLLALKALLPTHAGKVKCIYIDPPYNTGDEGWVYNDNLTQPQFKEWIGQTVGKEGEDATRHDKWCCMMYPRLTLLRELLNEQGVLFVSIDENESGNARLLLDEIFRVEMPLATLVWKRRSPTGMRSDPISVDHEYVFVYAKDNARVQLSGLERTADEYPLEDDRGRFASTDLTIGMTEDERPNQAFVIRNPRSGKKYPHNPDRVWRFEPEAMRKVIEDNLVIWPDEAEGSMTRPRFKTYFDPDDPQIKPMSSWVAGANEVIDDENEETIVRTGLNAEGGRALRQIFGTKVFDYPKPPSLIRSLVAAAASNGDVVLDSFAGSGTTGHAVLQQNAEDGIGRSFILVQQMHDNAEQKKSGENLCEKVTSERVRRIMLGYKRKNGKSETNKGLGGGFSYLRVGEPLFDEYRQFSANAPSYEDLAKYVFYTETSREIDLKKVNEATGLIGQTPAGGGTSYYLLYTPDPNSDREMSTRTLLDLLKKDKNRNWVIYCEKVWIHDDELREFEKKHQRRIRPMLVPFEMKQPGMDLKPYQRRVVDEVEAYLREVARERDEGNRKHAALDAWRNLRKGDYRERQNGLGHDLPHFCIKVPTGGGKTLLATQALGSIYRTLLKERNGAGLVLWIVPSSQIYRDTLRRLRERTDMYRIMLEHAVSRRLEIWEKHEVARLSPARLRDCLNILVLQLASTNRETKEQLKFFKDSGGNIVDHFPPEKDAAAHRQLKQTFPNLDMLEDDDARGRHLAATSIGNLVKLCQPPVILDEGHKATSQLARQTIEAFNASVVVELSATPIKDANLVSRVSGQELLDSEMIKLPLNIATSAQKSWKDVLTQARDKREALAKQARKYFEQAGERRLIRPIVLVQVERTGKDQRVPPFIHADDVHDYLSQRLDVPADAIRIKSAANDGLENVDLLDPGCPVQWIITKSALQEGWDCPFAYLLVSLNNTGSALSMTQLVGRVLRQPYQERTPFAELNESFVFCLRALASDVARQVKSALEKEGYEGDLEGLVRDPHAAERKREITLVMRPEFKKLYSREFKGKVYLPRFCVKEGQGAKAEYRPLDYFDHLVRQIDVEAFAYRKIDWRLATEMQNAKDRLYRFQLGTGLQHKSDTEIDLFESDDKVIAWLAANLKFDFLSHKQLGTIVRRVYETLVKQEMVSGRFAAVKFVVREKLQRFITEQLDLQTHAAFQQLFDAGRIEFYLRCEQCRFEVPSSINVQTCGGFKPLVDEDGVLVQKPLFDRVEHESHNDYERAVALVLDRDVNALWWYRNCVGGANFMIQGPRRHKIWPDFVVQGEHAGQPFHRVWVLESKGQHLEGNPDTNYKRMVADYFNRVGRQVTWQQLGSDFKDHVFRFQVLDQAQPLGRDWQDELGDILAG